MNKFCVDCGAKINENQQTCLKCGRVLNTKPKTNAMALTGFILGLVSFCLLNLWGATGILATIFSAIGLSQLHGQKCYNKGFAITGLVLGIVGTLVGLCYIAVY